MALSFFVQKPIELPERFRERTRHGNRFWVEGTPVDYGDPSRARSARASQNSIAISPNRWRAAASWIPARSP